jgi:cobalamin biosynthesis protein CobT
VGDAEAKFADERAAKDAVAAQLREKTADHEAAVAECAAKDEALEDAERDLHRERDRGDALARAQEQLLFRLGDVEANADRDRAEAAALIARLEAKAAELDRLTSLRPGPPASPRPKEVRCCAL